MYWWLVLALTNWLPTQRSSWWVSNAKVVIGVGMACFPGGGSAKRATYNGSGQLVLLWIYINEDVDYLAALFSAGLTRPP